ncbi:hypothetical protein BDY19DRAFT_308191 [Irpex rosettiformis]|uniref:Uncharacterized protein n=1 Tax=Irpex rosettiformis TaxID=378272 RepID=A0ACB8TZ93_9APHY|nr:hypothetical protein BDY19DRAFT_308191 [Irpex rosettiformis]
MELSQFIRLRNDMMILLMFRGTASPLAVLQVTSVPMFCDVQPHPSYDLVLKYSIIPYIMVNALINVWLHSTSKSSRWKPIKPLETSLNNNLISIWHCGYVFRDQRRKRARLHATAPC